MAISLFGIIKGLLVQREDDRTKQLEVSVNSSATTGTKTTLQASQTANRTVTLPDATDTLAGVSAAQSLTNKTIDADQNTITNIENADIKAGAAIDASKIADGSVSNAEFQLLNGITGGQVVTTSDAQTLTNKTIDGDNNTVQDLALTTLKTVLADANKFIARDAFGIPVSVNTVPAGTVVGTSDSQTLTNKTIDADSNTITNIENADIKAGAAIDRAKLASGTASHVLVNDGSGVMSSEATLAKSRGGSGQDNSSLNFPASGTLATLAGTEQLTNKDIDGATASDTSRITIPKASKSTLDALTRKQATVVYASDQNALYVDNGSTLLPVGSGSGGSKNYLTTYLNNAGNGDFEYGTTTGWSLGTTGTLTNAFPTGTPTFGSGASGNLSISTVTGGLQLSGTYSLSYASSAATTAGNMLASDTFTIDASDYAKALTFKFSYKAQTNPTNANWSGTSSNSFGVAIYDVTNNRWIQPAGCFGMTQSSGVGICSGTFQTFSNSSQYRFVIYNANATTGAVTVYFDDFSVGPQTVPIGPVVTEWQSYTPTFGAGFGTVNSAVGQYRRVGDDLEVKVSCNVGTVAAAVASISLPPGLTVNTSKLTISGNTTGQTGTQVGIFGENSTNALGFVLTAPATSTSLVYLGGNVSTATLNVVTTSASTTSLASGQAFSATFTVPIAGWATNVQQSNDTDTRVVAARFNTASARTFNISINNIVYENVQYDTHGAYNSSTGVYTVPVSGYYKISGGYVLSAVVASIGQGTSLVVKRNGTAVSTIASSRVQTTSSALQEAVGSTTFLFNAGDTLNIAGYADTTSTTVTATGTSNWACIERISGPAVIAATESVNVSAYNNSGQSIPNGATTTVTGWTKQFDTHNAFSTGGVFTVPVSGKYSVNLSLALSSGFTVNAGQLAATVTQSGSTSYIASTTAIFPNGNGASFGQATTHIFDCKAGDTLTMQCFQNNGASRSLYSSDTSVNRVSIARVGN